MNSSVNLSRRKNRPVLEFDRVHFGGRRETSIRLHDFSTIVEKGELVRVELDRHQTASELASAILGLIDVESGAIRFCGLDWTGNDFSLHFAMRRRIGRVFQGAAWVESLTLHDNLCLAMLHHGVEIETAESRVKYWGEKVLGAPLESIQNSLDRRPHSVEPSTLQLCQVVRAVCNEPRLLILERPTNYIPSNRYPDITSVINERRSAGTAVLLFAESATQDELTLGGDVTRWQVVDDILMTCEEKAS